MIFEQPFVDAVQQAVTPSQADILIARGVIFEAVAGASGPVLITEFENRWLAAIGSRRPSDRTRLTALPAAEPGRRLADPDPSDPHLAVVRCHHAVRWAVAQLVAEGVLVRGRGNQYALQPDSIPVDYPGGISGVPVMVHSPYVDGHGSAARFLRNVQIDDDGSEVLLPVDELLAGLEGILGVRGITMVRESRRALQRGCTWRRRACWPQPPRRRGSTWPARFPGHPSNWRRR